MKNSFKETEIGSLPEDWNVAKFEQAISKKRFKVGKIRQREYNKVGKYPVIDQSQKFIAGFTDDSERVYQGDLPIVIFGDHTRIFKLIDFPFVIGADGVKVILPEKVLVNPLFFYYALSNLKIQSRGYNRHYPLLREKVIPIPPLLEQQRIAKVLGVIQRAIEWQNKIIEAGNDLRKSLMQELFTKGFGHTEFKETEIGIIPTSWEAIGLGDIATISTGTTPSTLNKGYYNGEIPFVKTNEITNNIIRNAQVLITKKAVDDYNLKVYPSGTVFLAMYGQGKTRGQSALLSISATTSQNTAAIIPRANMDSFFLWCYLQYQYEKLRKTGIQGHISHLNLGYVKSFIVPLPSLREQKEIARILSTVNKKIEVEERKKAALSELFKTMLQKLMTGEIRLKDVEV
ncbi:MAG TPA: restriction endonuclease subunit S [Candidatus Bathyarchaeia archaeon]|nr:restriction endonuclease subunit S [Candidatus Bathyarchaeia archaeon]